jgi:type VI secretion system protein ImpB
MAKSFQHEKPPSRVNLFLEVATGDANEKVELPLRMLVMSDLTGDEPETPVEDRELISINQNNFQDVMRSYDLGLEYTVKDKLTGEGKIKVDLDFEDMDSFRPENVAQQVPELSRLLAARNLLQDLRNRMISMGEFRKQLEKVISDEEMRNELLSELQQVMSADSEDPSSGDSE